MKCDRLRPFAAKIETTAGTAISLDATNATVPVFNVTYSDNTTYTKRENVSGGNLQGRRGALIGTIGIEVEVMGSGSTGVPAWADLFLPPCGFVKSSDVFTFTRNVANQKTLTMRSYIDGQYRALRGAAGTVSLQYNAGAISRMRFNFTGIVDPVGEATNPSPTLITTQPILGATAFTYHNGTTTKTLKAPTATINWNGTVAPIEDPSTDGFERFCVSDFNPTMQIEPYADAFDQINWDSDWTNNAERSVSLMLGSGAGTFMLVEGTKASQNQPPGWGERNRLVTRIINLDFNDDLAPTISFSET